MKDPILRSVILLLLTLEASPSAVWGAEDEKMESGELIKRHVASIGTAQAIAAVRARSIGGTVHVTFRLGGHGDLYGRASILSEAGKIRIGMTFPSIQYSGEQLAYDGNRVATGHVRPGQRKALSHFVYLHELLLRESLIGGTATTAWALLSTAQRQPELKYTGLKKVEGKRQHELKYRAGRGADDLQISLCFDPETFRHTSSIYKLVRTANMATSITESPGQRDAVYKMLEQFEDFKQVDGLTLPHTYKLVFSVEGEPTVLRDWVITIDDLSHNVPIDRKSFAVQ